MALTTAQLVAQFTNANLGKGPDAATQLLLDAYASQTQTGALTDGQATSKVIDLIDKTTSVAIATYQFFTGKTPSSAGLTYLVNSDDAGATLPGGNKTDLNDAYYSKFATENRYINFAINLGADPASEANKSFASSYGSLTFRQVVEVAYEKVIGTAAAQAGGINVAAAIDFLARAENENYLKSFVKQYAPGVDQDLGVKAAVVGTIISAGMSANVGAYASSAEKMVQDLADDGKTASTEAVDLLVAYPPTQVVQPTKTLTDKVDTLVGTGSAEFFAGVVGGANATFSALDTVDGGGGIDTLTLVDGSNGDKAYADPAGVTVKNLEVVNYISSGGSDINATGALSSVGTINVTENASATVTGSSSQILNVTSNSGTSTVVGGSTQTVTATGGNVVLSKAAGAVSLTETKHDGKSSVDGGTSVKATVTTTAKDGSLVIGAATAPTGAIDVTVNSNLTAAGAGIATTVTGGSSVTVTSNASMVSATKVAETTTQGPIVVTSSSNTKSVTVTQSAPVTEKAAAAAVPAVAGVTETASVKFGDLKKDDTVELGGLTFTATGAVKAAELAAAFANLAAGAGGPGDDNGSPLVNGSFSGKLTGFSTGAVANKDTVTFTSTTKNAPVDDLTNTGTVTPTVTTVQGVKAVSAVAAAAAVGGIATGTVTVNDDGNAVGTVAITNAAAVTITSKALTALTLAGTVSFVNINNVAGVGKSGTLNLTLSGTKTALADLNSAYSTLAVTTAGATASEIDVDTVDGATALTVGGTQALTLTNSEGMVALNTVTVSGAAGVTGGVFTQASVTSVDASASSGSNTISVDATKATYKGGTGADKVTITAAPTKSIDGGAGTDTLVVDIEGGFNASGNVNITGFETLELGAKANAFDYDATGFTALRAGVTAGAAVFKNVAAGVGLTLTDTATITYALKDDKGTSDSLALTTSNKANKTFAVTAAGIESIALTATGASDATTHTVNLTAAALKSITVGGSASVKLGEAITASTVDASALTGKFVYTADDASATVTGGAAADSITIAANNVTVSAGAGNDTITVNKGVGLATITTGAGSDVIDIKGPAANLNSYVTITDFSAGDVLSFNGIPVNGNEAFTRTKVTLAATASFQDYADAVIAAGGNAGADAKLGWFQFGGDTYIIVSQHDGAATPTFQNNVDIAVRLTGVIDLASAFNDLGAATGAAGVAEFRL
jgi:S-layer protein